MKTNVGIELTDAERSILANWLDGKESKRLATRADVNAFVTQTLRGVLDRQAQATIEREPVRDVTGPRFSELIERNIHERGYNEFEAKSYRHAWTQKPFKQ